MNPPSPLLPLDWLDRVRRYERSVIEDDRIVRRAATAVICVESGSDGPELLFMVRASRDDDPWSGQISFPGGHADPSEELARTAIREAHEELGVVLGEVIGALDDRPVHTGPHTVVTPFVFVAEERPALTIDPGEVAAGLFVPMRHLVDPARQTRHLWRRGETSLAFPAIQIDGAPSLWGLTYRSVANFLELLGHAIEDPQPKPI